MALSGRAMHRLRSDIFNQRVRRRDYRGAKADLAQSLEIPGLEVLDLWQVHDVRTRRDVEEIEGPRGALQAFLEAKDPGRVRFLASPDTVPEVLEHAP